MRATFSFLLLLIILLGCSRKETDSKAPPLTDQDKKAVESYAKSLTKSINEFEHELIKKSWSNEAFKNRVEDLNKVEKNVFIHLFNEEISDEIKFSGLTLVNQVSSEKGKVYLTKVEHRETYSEITLTLVFPFHYTFLRYRVEMINNKPYICDIFDIKSNTWYSQSIKNLIHLSSRYNAQSKERKSAIQAMSNYQKQLDQQDTVGALYYLNQVSSLWIGNGLKLMRLNLAHAVSDSIYSEVLEEEYNNSESLYIEYLYRYYWSDSSELGDIYDQLVEFSGEKQMLDSLNANGYFWQ